MSIFNHRRASPWTLMLASASVIALSAPVTAAAQEAVQEEEEVQLEEIIVTARKRSEQLQDIPLAVTAVTSQDIENQSISALDDLSNVVPNVSFSGGAGDSGVGSAVIFIRGIGQTDYANATDPGVGTYIDGVYLGRSTGGVVELPDIAQVEVLRGPQGTLFGKNTMGGAINITTQGPAADTGGAVQVTAGSDSRFNLDAHASLRFSDALGLRFSFASRRQDGFVERLNGGEALGDEELLATRFTLDYSPDDRLRVRLSADYSAIDGSTPRVVTEIRAAGLAALWNAAPAALAASIASNGAAPVDPSLGFQTYAELAGQAIDSQYARTDLRSTNAGGSYDNVYNGGGVSARIDYQLTPLIGLRSITAYRGFDAASNADQDGQSVAWGQVRYGDEQSQFSQEFNLLGESADGRLDWIAGLYYFSEDATADQTIALADPFIRFQNDFSTDTRSYAAFGEGSYSFTDRLTGTLGLRYTRETKDFAAQVACRDGMILTFLCTSGFYVPYTELDETWESYDPRVGLKYDVSDDLMVYATYSTGFKSGGFNVRASNASQLLPFDPETVAAYEIGAKGAFADGRLRVSTAAFFYQYDDYQVTATGTDSQSGAPVAVVGNVGEVEVRGFEIESQAEPTDWLTLNGSVGYVDAEYVSLSSTLADFFADTGNAPITLDNKLPKTPEWTVNLGAEVLTPLSGADIRWRADYAWVDEQYSDVQNFEATRSPAHSNLNARISYEPHDGRWTAAIYGKNLTDEVYLVNGFIPDGGNGAQTLVVPNEPREIGVQLKLQL